MSTVAIRALDPAEWELFRDFRLSALSASPGVFATSYEEAAARTPQMWQATIKGPTYQVFGLFEDGELIGITAVFGWADDPTGQTAMLVMSFILPSHRGRGLSRMLYDARLAWVRKQSQFRRVVVAHRQSNESVRRIVQRFGFAEKRRSAHAWPDGTIEDEVFYELVI